MRTVDVPDAERRRVVVEAPPSAYHARFNGAAGTIRTRTEDDEYVQIRPDDPYDWTLFFCYFPRDFLREARPGDAPVRGIERRVSPRPRAAHARAGRPRSARAARKPRPRTPRPQELAAARRNGVSIVFLCDCGSTWPDTEALSTHAYEAHGRLPTRAEKRPLVADRL